MSGEIGREFMEKTCHGQFGPSDQQCGAPPPPPVSPPDPALARIELPPPEQAVSGPVDFLALVNGRTSCRRYARTPLSLAELSFLLWCTQGIKQMQQGLVAFRTVPSAGARHAFETLLLVNRVEGLEAGLYGYDAAGHRLAQYSTHEGLAEAVVGACYGQDFVRTSAATFLWLAVPYRMTWRYGQRGYRYLHLDAGHVGQNLYLAAEAIGCGACAVGAFDDEALGAFLGLDGRNQFIIYLAAVGKRP